MPARSIDTATIAFGLVSIPVKIYSTGEPSHEVHFHLLHAGCGERIRQQYVCPVHGAVERDALAKGYEVAKDEYVELAPAELKALDAVASEAIEMSEFVPASAVDPIQVDRSYYLGVAKGGERAYRLFRDALEHAGLVGIGSYAARGKQYVVELRPYQDGLLMHQLRYPDEIKAWSEVPSSKLPKPTTAELSLAGRVIAALTRETFDPSKYKDEVKARVRKLIGEKLKGGEIVAPEAAPRETIAELMEALKASLGQGDGKSKKLPPKPAPKPAATSTATSTAHAAHAAPRAAHDGKRTRKTAAHTPRPRRAASHRVRSA